MIVVRTHAAAKRSRHRHFARRRVRWVHLHPYASRDSRGIL